MEAAGGLDVRRRQMLADNRANSGNLRDMLRIKQDENNNRSNVSNNNTGGNNLVGLTLGAVLSGDMRSVSMPVQQNRTLFDIIRDEPVAKTISKDGKKSWKLLKKKLKLRRAGSGSAWSSSVPIPASDVGLHQNNNRTMTRRHSTSSTNGSTQQPEAEASSSSLSSMMTRSSSAVMLQRNVNGENAETEDREESPEVAQGDIGEQPARMSLMALLEESDRQMGLDGPALMGDSGDSDDSEDQNEFEDVQGGESGGGKVAEYNSCCVCMVRTKGSAFIPCGHTFCRLCSRELWVQRGNCPLCNNFILEILDIF